MPDWTKSMKQSFEYYIVDPKTWKNIRLLDNVKGCSITRDSSTETRGSATIDVTNSINECYIRVYLIAEQNNMTEKIPLGTFLVQTPSLSFNGRTRSVSMDAYAPLLELKENQPPIGYTLLKGEKIMESAYIAIRDHIRAPVVKAENNEVLTNDFVANIDDTWLTFITDLIGNAKFEFDVDELGRILFAPKQEIDTLQPVWTYNDDNSSILLPEISMDHDLYGIPNVVEVTYSDGENNYYARVVNDDINSPTSITNRGREIIHRETDPNIGGIPSQYQIEQYAEALLKELSSIEYTIHYTHGYCPVRLGDCIRLNYNRAGINNIKAKVISQNIKCESGCQVTETAVFTSKLWR